MLDETRISDPTWKGTRWFVRLLPVGFAYVHCAVT
jgi:hypothetical protein